MDATLLPPAVPLHAGVQLHAGREVTALAYAVDVVLTLVAFGTLAAVVLWWRRAVGAVRTVLASTRPDDETGRES